MSQPWAADKPPKPRLHIRVRDGIKDMLESYKSGRQISFRSKSFLLFLQCFNIAALLPTLFFHVKLKHDFDKALRTSESSLTGDSTTTDFSTGVEPFRSEVETEQALERTETGSLGGNEAVIVNISLLNIVVNVILLITATLGSQLAK